MIEKWVVVAVDPRRKAARRGLATFLVRKLPFPSRETGSASATMYSELKGRTASWSTNTRLRVG